MIIDKKKYTRTKMFAFDNGTSRTYLGRSTNEEEDEALAYIVTLKLGKTACEATCQGLVDELSECKDTKKNNQNCDTSSIHYLSNSNTTTSITYSLRLSFCLLAMQQLPKGQRLVSPKKERKVEIEVKSTTWLLTVQNSGRVLDTGAM